MSQKINSLLEDPDWFPFVETWTTRTPVQMFEALVSSPYGGSVAGMPKVRINFGRGDFKFSIPPRFSKPIPALGSEVLLTHDIDNRDYRLMNALGEFYMEDLRLTSSKRRFMQNTPMEMWDRDKKRIVEIARSKAGSPEVGPYEIRNAIFDYTHESNPFRPTIALAVYSLLNATSILDMSSGWGDRLLGALAWAQRSRRAIRYQGYDPFMALQERYARMISDFAPVQDGERFSVSCAPFEEAPIEENAFDVAFTSPPYFDFEEYGLDTKKQSDRSGQSTVRYPGLQDWVEGFLKPMMQRASQSLRMRGYLAINIEGPFLYKLLENSATDPALFGRSPPRMEYQGIIGYRSDNPDDRFTHPIFVWRRVV